MPHLEVVFRLVSFVRFVPSRPKSISPLPLVGHDSWSTAAHNKTHHQYRALKPLLATRILFMREKKSTDTSPGEEDPQHRVEQPGTEDRIPRSRPDQSSRDVEDDVARFLHRDSAGVARSLSQEAAVEAADDAAAHKQLEAEHVSRHAHTVGGKAQVLLGVEVVPHERKDHRNELEVVADSAPGVLRHGGQVAL